MGKNIIYHFEYNDQEKIKKFSINIELDEKTLLLNLTESNVDQTKLSAVKEIQNSSVQSNPTDFPDWCLLENKKCQHCPLSASTHKYCPVAKNLSVYLKNFNNEISHKPVTICVETKERKYIKNATMQDGAFGIFGLVMATSGCPHLDLYRPIARFHLPFANSTETMVRNLSFYLLQQYFKKQNGETYDFEFKNLAQLLDAVNLVNKGIIERIRSLASRGDTDKNAIVILDSFASILSMELSDNFSELKNLVL